MTIILHAWGSLRETFEARASEWALAGATLSLGLVCLLNTDLFTSGNFNRLSLIAPQPVWAMIFLTMGTSRLIMLLINGAWWRTPLFRCAGAFLTCFMWFQLTLGFAANASFALAVFPWLFALDAYNALRAGRESGLALGLHRGRDKNGHTGITER